MSCGDVVTFIHIVCEKWPPPEGKMSLFYFEPVGRSGRFPASKAGVRVPLCPRFVHFVFATAVH